MVDFEDVFPVIVAIIIAILLFLGITTIVKKTLTINPRHKNTINSSMSLREQQYRMDDIRQRQKELIRDQRQKIRDLQRR